VYAKRPGHTEFIAHPDPQVTIVNALSGAGMTLSFGLAEEVVQVLLGPSQSTPPSPTVGLPS
jgi:glycine/D-amino acid oxidase-like deaminating enzyme